MEQSETTVLRVMISNPMKGKMIQKLTFKLAVKLLMTILKRAKYPLNVSIHILLILMATDLSFWAKQSWMALLRLT